MRYLEILELLLSPAPDGGGGFGWTAREIAEETNYPRSSINGYLRKMLAGGFIIRRGNVYTVAGWFLDHAEACSKHTPDARAMVDDDDRIPF